ncbi:hypothetical protein NUACC21_56000 [Scytonema sp. NUACC21]
MTFSSFPEFFSTSNVKMYLKIGDLPLDSLPVVKLQNKEMQSTLPYQPYLIELHPVFSHMSILLIESLVQTGHGEFITRSKQEKYQTTVDLSGHVSYRYRLDKQQVEEIQQVHEKMIESWMDWWRLHKKSYKNT